MSPDSTDADRAALFDDLALAYAADPAAIGRLLASHAARVIALDFAVVDDRTTDYERAMRAAEADATREALLAEVTAPSAEQPLAAVIPLHSRTAQNGHSA
ncbi:hypothetical protein ACOKM5_24385 [Streptomyces sp. BH097]|uniref:hypothetical protein n=1 Tax=Streptomyces sp. BH097 TaxID=3410406 RepID=UPI003CEC47A3